MSERNKGKRNEYKMIETRKKKQLFEIVFMENYEKWMKKKK